MLTTCIAVLALGASGSTQEQDGELRSQLESMARAALADAGLPGLALRVVDGEQVALSKAWGYLDTGRRTLESVEVPRAAPAMLEPLVAVALLTFAERGQIDLGRELGEPFSALDFGGQKVRIAQLLTHTSGIPSFAELARGRSELLQPAQALEWLAARSLDSDPGSCFAYSESNTFLAGQLVERVGQAKLDETLARVVLEPLRLTSTSFRTSPEDQRTTVELIGERRELALSRLAGWPEVYTTLEDLLAFARAVDAGALIGVEGRRLATEALRAKGEDLPFTHGFARSLLASHPSLSFGGSTERGSVFVAWYPDAHLALALATGADTDVLPQLERRLARACLRLPEPGIVDLPIDAEHRAPYLGSYYIGCTRVELEDDGERLVFVTPFDERHALRYQGGQRFVSLGDPDLSLEFSVERGRAQSFLLMRRGTQTVGRRIDGA